MEPILVSLRLQNQPGALAEISRKLARADINIEYAYCTAATSQGNGSLIIKSDELDRNQERRPPERTRAEVPHVVHAAVTQAVRDHE